jgi:SPP1 family predicted phage head-tail adaptor
MRNRVEVQQAQESADAHGQTSRAWTTIATRWASISSEAGAEVLEGGQQDVRNTHSIRMRSFPVVQADTHRLIVRGIVYDLDSVTHDQAGKQRTTRMAATDTGETA